MRRLNVAACEDEAEPNAVRVGDAAGYGSSSSADEGAVEQAHPAPDNNGRVNPDRVEPLAPGRLNVAIGDDSERG